MSFLEIALFDVPSPTALNTLSTYASRLEVCGGPYSSGGLTPSIQVITSLRQSTALSIHAMLRPRSGDFTYSEVELQTMKADLEAAVGAGAEGVVFGILRDGKVNEEQTLALCQLAKTRGVTCVFHRAFDEVQEWREGLAALKRCGVDAVLTSGGRSTAMEGVMRLRDMWEEAKRLGIEIIVGGGVRSSNIKDLQRETCARWFHSAALVKGSEVVSKDEVRALRHALGQSSQL